jgi:hypothetical protein
MPHNESKKEEEGFAENAKGGLRGSCPLMLLKEPCGALPPKCLFIGFLHQFMKSWR